jgi:hypothetical protein
VPEKVALAHRKIALFFMAIDRWFLTTIRRFERAWLFSQAQSILRSISASTAEEHLPACAEGHALPEGDA